MVYQRTFSALIVIKISMSKKTKVVLKPPDLDIKDEYYTGAPQEVTQVDVELLQPIIVKYSDDEVTEFRTLMPVKITIKRK